MTRKVFEDRRQAYQAELEQVIAHARRLEGAIADCDFWIHEFDKAEAIVVDPEEDL